MISTGAYLWIEDTYGEGAPEKRRDARKFAFALAWCDTNPMKTSDRTVEAFEDWLEELPIEDSVKLLKQYTERNSKLMAVSEKNGSAPGGKSPIGSRSPAESGTSNPSPNVSRSTG